MGMRGWVLASGGKQPETPPHLVKGEAWLKVGVRGWTGSLELKGLRIRENKRHCELEEIREMEFS